MARLSTSYGEPITISYSLGIVYAARVSMWIIYAKFMAKKRNPWNTFSSIARNPKMSGNWHL